MHRVDHPKAKTERDSKSLKRRINSVTEEDSYKEISRFVQRNPAYREEGLVTHSTLTQGKAAPREGQERAREKGLPTESQQLLGGERTIPGPQHIRK